MVIFGFHQFFISDMPLALICRLIDDWVFFVYAVNVVLIKNQLFIESILAFVVLNHILMDSRQRKKKWTWKKRKWNAAEVFLYNQIVYWRMWWKAFSWILVFSSVWYFSNVLKKKHLVNKISDKRVCPMYC